MSDREPETNRRHHVSQKGSEVALPERTELPLPEEPMAQVAVPATIHGTSPLNPYTGPLPPKSQATKKDKRPEEDNPQPVRE